MNTKFNFHQLIICGFFLLCLSLFVAPASAQPAKVSEVVDQTKTAVQDASTAAADEAKTIWRRLKENRLINRTRDELIAWVLIGALVGALAGLFTPLKPTLSGKLGKLLLGLAGAFIGGTVVNVTRIDFGWGAVVLGYEEILFSLAGAILLVVLARLLFSKRKKTD